MPLNIQEQESPIFDYEITVIKAISENRHVWIKKAAGLGITELILRYLAFVCLSSDKLENKSIFIVSGLRETFANELKIRLEKLFDRKYPGLKLPSKYTELWLNKTWIKVFPTEAIKTLRGHTNVAYLFCDEADHFDSSGWRELPAAIKRYDQKSNCKFIFVSTPNKPLGLFDLIERDEIFKGWFHKLYLGYEYGIGKMYTQEFINKEKGNPDFEREYNLVYGGTTGNYFHIADIKRAIQDYEIRPYYETTVVMGIDTGWASSWFAIVIMMYHKGKLYVQHVERHKRPTPQYMIDRLMELYKEFRVYKLLIDGSDPEFIYMIKDRLRDYPPAQYAKNLNNPYDYHDVPQEYYQDMKVIPTTFTKKPMIFLNQDRMLLQQDKIMIAPQFKDLIAGLYEVYVDRGKYIKEDKEFNDLVDAFSETCDYFIMKSQAAL